MANRLVDDELSIETLWSILGRGFLWEIDKSCSDAILRRDMFRKTVVDCIEKKQSTVTASHNIKREGKILYFDPSLVMYEGICEEKSNGFFDVADAPPPELWIGLENDVLVSYVPKKFMSEALHGAEYCVTDCLYW